MHEEIHEPMTHCLKCHPDPFQALRKGLKGFEYRFFDRPFQVGDILILEEYDPNSGQFTGEQEIRSVDYLISNAFGIPADYCIMSWMPGNVSEPKNVELPEKVKEALTGYYCISPIGSPSIWPIIEALWAEVARLHNSGTASGEGK